jgi:hypothetical protein
MMRPVFRRILPGSMLASDPSSNPLSGGNHSKGIKMASMTRTKVVDDTSSTRQLVSIEDRLSVSVEFGRGGEAPSGPRTVILSQASHHDDAPDQDDKHRQGRVIHVTNDVSISYEQV